MSEQLKNWLDELGLGQYYDAFSSHDIDWALLPELNQDVLKDIGITSAGHRLRLLQAVREVPRKADGREDAERRQLTVMFCDLVDSTVFAAKLDPEDLRDVNLAYQDACKLAIDRFEGYIARYMGDGVLAYFGYPLAHEDDAERAVLAGLDVVQEIQALSRDIGDTLGIRLSVRIGIATGEVVVGDLIGEGAAQESAVVGGTPNLAARLQSMAKPDQVIVASRTHALCGSRIAFEDLDKHRVRGLDSPIHLWSPIGSVRAESRFDSAQRGELTPFTDRHEVLATLMDRWQLAVSAKGQVVLLAGEPGIGKSRIAQVFRERIAASEHGKLRFQCSPHHTHSAFYPLINQLQFAARLDSDDTDARKLEKLDHMLASYCDTKANTTAMFARLLAIPTGKQDETPELKPQALREQTFQAFLDHLEGMCARGPVLLELEDAHWIDPTMLELVSLVVDAIVDWPVYMLVTLRPEFECPWSESPHATFIPLDHLGAADSRVIIENLSSGRALSAALQNRIAERADGNPLFIEEMTKDVLESEPSHGEGQNKAVTIPASLQDSLMSRLDRLGSAKRLAQIGAALGREFPRDMLQTVAEMPSQVFEVALRQLQRAGLLFERGVQGKQTCVFKHALVQEAAYGSLLKRRRQELHVHIAEVLSEQRADLMTSQPEVLARHWSEGGRANEAHPCWLAAGKMATQRFALEEARTFFTKGLEAVALLDSGEAKDAIELEFRVALGTVLRMSVGPGAPETQANYDAAVLLCDRLPESPDQFAALWGKWINAMNFKLELGLEWTQRLLQLATKLDDAGFHLQAHHATWTTLFHIGRFADAYDHTHQGLAYYDEEAHRHHAAQYGGHDPRICGGGFAAHALWMLDRHDESLAFARRCTEWGEKLGETGSLLHVIEIHLLLYLFRDEPEQSTPWMERLSVICEENDLPEYAGKLRFNTGWRHASRGELEPGIRMMLEGRENQVKVGSLEDIPLFSEKLASFLSGVERIDEGLQLLDESLEIAESNSLCYWLAEVHRRRGILLDKKGESVAARDSLRTALNVAIEQKAIALQRRAAQSLLTHSDYHEHENTPDVIQARELLQALNGS